MTDRIDEMIETAAAMVSSGRGVLAIDESTGTCQKRFDTIGVDCTEDNRRDYRHMLLSADGLGEYISGAILFDETIRQKAPDGTSLVKIMQDADIIPGIKVDKGAKDLAGFPGEKVTEGLDGLRERLHEYYDMGARFAKWRAVITISENNPSQTCIEANSHALARYAALCQEAGLVPIVEPEVLMDGSHDIATAYEVTELTLKSLFSQLYEHNVILEACILKSSMVVSGSDCPEQADAEEVAEATLSCFFNTVPAALAGIVFLSGGQSEIEATEHLNVMNQMGQLPWPLSFSYGRALQASALKVWGDNPKNNVKAAQAELLHRARMNSLATLGQYDEQAEQG
ncbi:putative fructose-bisphosphate aldolase class 1 [Marinicella pacifica]|jgi:fructose-bisphosphate aldolase class I|uniref:Probable fructose-bisphosphate aldolase class 1 n=1 Tax=Marinicella pacifica TaxID=1171543 RepID=A0A917FRW0_9GAMM|nr:class I fructose-bisphosphate aldolase [Marinicella pacifica]GGF98556.1 putative fructose-bisphosphate aldolase class 1 [Marinicella pacifica]